MANNNYKNSINSYLETSKKWDIATNPNWIDNKTVLNADNMNNMRNNIITYIVSLLKFLSTKNTENFQEKFADKIDDPNITGNQFIIDSDTVFKILNRLRFNNSTGTVYIDFINDGLEICGLKNLEENSDHRCATNKKYVDDQDLAMLNVAQQQASGMDEQILAQANEYTNNEIVKEINTHNEDITAHDNILIEINKAFEDFISTLNTDLVVDENGETIQVLNYAGIPEDLYVFTSKEEG